MSSYFRLELPLPKGFAGETSLVYFKCIYSFGTLDVNLVDMMRTELARIGNAWISGRH
jgi:hypothetical protein